MKPTDSILSDARKNGSAVRGNVVVSYDRAARTYAVGTVLAVHAQGQLSVIERPLMALLAGCSDRLEGMRFIQEMSIRAAQCALAGQRLPAGTVRVQF